MTAYVAARRTDDFKPPRESNVIFILQLPRIEESGNRRACNRGTAPRPLVAKKAREPGPAIRGRKNDTKSREVQARKGAESKSGTKLIRARQRLSIIYVKRAKLSPPRPPPAHETFVRDFKGVMAADRRRERHGVAGRREQKSPLLGSGDLLESAPPEQPS